MNKWFKETGFFNDNEPKILSKFRSSLKDLMKCNDVKEMSVAELQMLKSNLHKMIGDTISDHILSKSQELNKLNAMTDDQFDEFLKKKYGNEWFFAPLAPEERERSTELFMKNIKEALEKSAEAAHHMPCNGVRFSDRHPRFK